MGAAMGQDPVVLEEVCGWVMGVSKIPVWAKMTPNVTHIEEPTAAALRAGCHGVSAINTIRSVMGVNLETLRPEPTVEGYATPGGYSSREVKPIALRMVMEIAQLIKKDFPGRSLSGLGGVETGANAAQFILLGSDTVQVCTGVMKFGYGMAKELCEGLLESMEGKGFNTIDDFKGLSLPYFTTHAELVRIQLAPKAEDAAAKMPGDLKVCYFVNSGSEANDLAVLMARAYTGNYDLVALRNAYHGGSPGTMAEGIGNGCPLAAVVTTPEIARSLASRIHFNTFGGNPVSCAQGRAARDRKGSTPGELPPPRCLPDSRL